MNVTTQETKIENLRIHADSKQKILAIKREIQADTRINPSLSETIDLMSESFWLNKSLTKDRANKLSHLAQ